MSPGLVGRKVGMTAFFAEDGRSIPVTVLDVSGQSCPRSRRLRADGYAAVQVTFGKRRASRLESLSQAIWPRPV